jgi:glutamine---fructose-6-phosphate transaminase (isomerizing)
MSAASSLEREIREQPDTIRRLLSAETDRLAELAARWAAQNDIHALLLAGRGTSDNAARYAQYVFGAHNRLQVALATPSLFTRYGRPPRLTGFLVGAISQSGRSPDIVSVIAEARRQYRPTVVVTNDGSSPLAAASDAVVLLHAGTEHSVAATKTYTASLAAIAAISLAHTPDPDRSAQLASMPERVAEAIGQAWTDVTIPDWLVDAQACVVVGRGFNYATAFETALKLKELTGIAAEPYSSADLLHGPVAAVSWRTPVVLIAPSGEVSEDLGAVATRLRERGARLVVVSDDEVLLESADLPLRLPSDVPEWLSALTAVIPGQVLAWRLAAARGLDVDRPEGLAKVTETR